MDIVITEAREEDLPAVLPLYGQLNMEDELFLELDQARAIFRNMRGYPFYRLYTARLEDAVVAVFSLLIMDNLGHGGAPSAVLENVVVEKTLRGRGIGRTIAAHVLNLCREKGCYKLSLSSNKMRHDAHRFYDNLGFARYGVCFAISPDQGSVKAPAA